MKKTKEKKAVKSKRMPRKIAPDYIGCETEGQRKSLAYYYAIGGKEYAFGEFKGRVLQIVKGKGILFKRIYVKFDDCYGLDIHTVEDVEDHVWVYDVKPFLDKGIKVNDCVSFSALVYAYKRQDGTSDYALKECCNIKIIPKYDLPDMKEVNLKSAWRAAEQLACETCLYSEHCYGEPCIAAPRYREERTKEIFYSSHPEIAEKELNKIKEKLTSDVYLGVQLAMITGNKASEVGVKEGVIVIGAPVTSCLIPGDRITNIDGRDISSVKDIVEAISSYRVGDFVKVTTDLPNTDPVIKNVELHSKDDMAVMLFAVQPVPY